MNEAKLEAHLEEVFGLDEGQKQMFSLRLNHEIINDMMLSPPALVFEAERYETDPSLSMGMTEYREYLERAKDNPDLKWIVKNPHFQEPISVETWPFEKVPYMPVGFGAAAQHDGQAYQVYITPDNKGGFEYKYLTPDQANQMLREINENLKDEADFNVIKHSYALSRCVGNGQNEPQIQINDPEFKNHLVEGFEKPLKPEKQVVEAPKEEPVVVKPEPKAEAPKETVEAKPKPSEPRKPRPDLKRDFTKASNAGLSALEKIKTLSAPAGDEPTQGEYSNASRLASRAVQYIAFMGDEGRAEVADIFNENGYESMGKIISDAVATFKKDPENFKTDAFTTALHTDTVNYEQVIREQESLERAREMEARQEALRVEREEADISKSSDNPSDDYELSSEIAVLMYVGDVSHIEGMRFDGSELDLKNSTYGLDKFELVFQLGDSSDEVMQSMANELKTLGFFVDFDNNPPKVYEGGEIGIVVDSSSLALIQNVNGFRELCAHSAQKYINPEEKQVLDRLKLAAYETGGRLTKEEREALTQITRRMAADIRGMDGDAMLQTLQSELSDFQNTSGVQQTSINDAFKL